VPRWLADFFEGIDDDPETRKLVAAHVTGEQCRMLQDEGVQQFHFYTLNRPELSRAICRLLGIRPAVTSPSVAVTGT
jgi:methylenetetrahydrofolate reductase (NADPH)